MLVEQRRTANVHDQVICICGADGFPFGSGTAARITMVGKALQAAGMGYKLLHCGPSPTAINTAKSGTYEGIDFEYTSPVKSGRTTLGRRLALMLGVFWLTVRMLQVRWRLRRSHRRAAVYLYILGGPINFYVGCLCRLLGFPTVQEICEWPPDASEGCPPFTRWLYRKPIFTLASGALVISKAIERYVSERGKAVNPELLIYRVPCMVDFNRFAHAASLDDESVKAVPHFVWCGTWLIDVTFLLRAFVLVRNQGYQCRLTIIGPNAERDRDAILASAAENGITPENIVLAGCVDDNTLQRWYKSAAALLLPLRYDEVSRTRMPNKLAEYLASARPVVTSAIGEQADFLRDGINAYLAEPANEVDFANQMMRVLQDPEAAARVGSAGQRVCRELLDYRAHIDGLTKLFVDCIERSQQLPSLFGRRAADFNQKRVA